MEFLRINTMDHFKENDKVLLSMCKKYSALFPDEPEAQPRWLCDQIVHCLKQPDWMLFLFLDSGEPKGFLIAKLMQNSVAPVLFVIHVYCPGAHKELWTMMQSIGRAFGVFEIQGLADEVRFRAYRRMAGSDRTKKAQMVRWIL